MQLVVTSGKLERIREAQTEAVREENWKKERIKGMVKDLTEGSNGMKYRNDRIWVPNTCGVKSLLLDEAHKSRYSIHPRATKMYRDLKQNYWWSGMKRDVVKYVEKVFDLFTSQSGASETIRYHASIGMAPYEMLYGRKCRTPVCWGEVGPRELTHKDIVGLMNKKIDIVRAHLKAAQDRQKAYADKRRRPI
ncbi:uncharacterized protein LOC110887941 [Helianthus annuus]|uniref:uncharacterized protein LOC110887941 n=1 Tax=Helianthus annuus TaxID=4232 RepID=UPI000B8F9262|nr:uncharacterized protein LOC110887941 [Helianthus annuus]